jgi:hypothetical protein
MCGDVPTSENMLMFAFSSICGCVALGANNKICDWKAAIVIIVAALQMKKQLALTGT